MNSKFIPVFASFAMIAGLPGYAIAGWQDNVPHDFVPQQHQRMLKDRKARDAGQTTGPTKYAPRHPAVRRSVPSGTNY